MLFKYFVLPLLFYFQLVATKPEIDNSVLSSSKPRLCNFCIEAVLHVKYGLENDLTRESVEYGLQLLCDYLSIRPLIFICKKQVHKTYQSILDLLESGVDDPKEVCKIIKLCPNAVEDSDEIMFHKF